MRSGSRWMGGIKLSWSGAPVYLKYCKYEPEGDNKWTTPLRSLVCREVWRLLKLLF
jgi:hypothetical protein